MNKEECVDFVTKGTFITSLSQVLILLSSLACHGARRILWRYHQSSYHQRGYAQDSFRILLTSRSQTGFSASTILRNPCRGPLVCCGSPLLLPPLMSTSCRGISFPKPYLAVNREEWFYSTVHAWSGIPLKEKDRESEREGGGRERRRTSTRGLHTLLNHSMLLPSRV